MIRYDTIWYDMIHYYMLWYYMILYDTIWYGMIRYDRIFILGEVDSWGGEARQVILFGDELALQPCNQVNLLGKHMYQIYISNIICFFLQTYFCLERMNHLKEQILNLVIRSTYWVNTWTGFVHIFYGKDE